MICSEEWLVLTVRTLPTTRIAGFEHVGRLPVRRDSEVDPREPSKGLHLLVETRGAVLADLANRR